MTTTYRYDAMGNLTRQSNELVDLAYRYDLNGRMTEEARTEGGATVRTGYKYDKAGQLTAFRRSDGHVESFAYDPVGNMVEKTLNGTKIAMTYDAANELKTMESPHGKLTYAYDLNGNLTQKTLGDRTDTYSYDARNHLKQYRGYDNYEVKYSYNALGMLHSRESSGNHSRTTLEELIAGKEDSDDPDGDGAAHLTTYVYDLTQPYYQVLTETTDGEVTSYTYGLERLAAYTEQTQTRYLYDGRGSVIQTVQTNNEKASFADAVRTSKAYSAYGELLTEKVSGYGYNGEYYDAATGMLNLRARQYEPAQARFSQRDSLKGSAASPRSLNAYLYCQNDAVNFFDASGAAMVAVNMTDGGGGRKNDSSTSSFLQKGSQIIKTAVSTAASAAAVAKAVNDQALANAQESSMFGVSSDPATVRHMARMNRAQAQESTPTVTGRSCLSNTKLNACMTQEEYYYSIDDYSIIYGPDYPFKTPDFCLAIYGPDYPFSAPSPTSQPKRNAGKYLLQSLEAMLLGDYSDEDPTWLSVGGSIAAGFFDVDLPLDLRDATYDVTHFKELERPWLRLGIDIIAFIPVIGALKYVDDFADLAKHADDIADIAKYSDDVFDYTRHADDVADWLDGLGDGAKRLDDVGDAANIADGIGDATKLTKKQVMDYVEIATKGPIDSDIVVIGKKIENSADSYEEVAKRMNAQYFDLANWDELSEIYSADEMWKINEEFLSGQIDSGKEILLTSNPDEYLFTSSGYGKELRYLDEHGYTFIEIGGNLWKAIKGN